MTIEKTLVLDFLYKMVVWNFTFRLQNKRAYQFYNPIGCDYINRTII